MQYPNFYDEVKSIVLYDALSDFLGAIDGGQVEITYLDCVKQAGHSCPTVAGAYLMACKGLEVLYPETLPQRGFIHMSMRDSKDEGVTGVISNVISFVVGANDTSGFKGIQGNFRRDNLLTYNIPMQGEVTLTRLDTHQSVTMTYDPSVIPVDERMMPLMGKNLRNVSSDEEKKLFRTLWQERVKKILLSTQLWDKLITVNT